MRHGRPVHAFATLAALLLGLTACGGSVSAPPVPAPNGASGNLALAQSGGTITLHAANGAAETLNFPAVSGPLPAGEVLSVSASTTAPAGLPAVSSIRRSITVKGRAKPKLVSYSPILYTTLAGNPPQPISFQTAPYVSLSWIALGNGATYELFYCANQNCTQWQPISNGIPSGNAVAFTPEPGSPVFNVPAGGIVLALAQVSDTPIHLSVNSLSIPNGSVASFSAAEAGYIAPFTVSVTGPFLIGSTPSNLSAGPITYTSGMSGPVGTTFYVGAQGSNGQTGQITVTDSAGPGETPDTETIALTIGNATPPPQQSIAISPVSTFAAGTVEAVTVSEAGFTGTFRASMGQSNPNVAVVSPVSAPSTAGGPVTFYLGGIGAGSQTLQISDGTNTASVNFSVTAAPSNVTIVALPNPQVQLLGDTNGALIGFPYADGSTGDIAITALNQTTSPLPAPSIPGGGTLVDAIEVTTLSGVTLGSQVTFGLSSLSTYPSYGEEFYVPSIPGAPQIPGFGAGQWNANPSPCSGQGAGPVVCSYTLNQNGLNFGAIAIPPGLSFGFLVYGASQAIPLSQPAGLTVANNNLYVANQGTNQVLVYDLATLTQQPAKTISAGVNGPARLASDSKGDIYVANAGNNTVTEYGPDGGSPILTLSNNITRPLGLAVDSASGYIYVGDDTLNSPGPGILVFDQSGNQKAFVRGDGNGLAFQPGALALSTVQGTQFIIVGNGSVSPNADTAYSTAPLLLGVPPYPLFSIGNGVSGPTGFAFSPDGTVLYESNLYAGNVTLYSTQTQQLTATLTNSIGTASGVAVDPSSGNVFVSSGGSPERRHRVYRRRRSVERSAV